MSEQKAYLTTSPAEMRGEAARIPAAIKARPSVLRATIQITRAATGKVEEYQIVGVAEETTQKD